MDGGTGCKPTGPEVCDGIDNDCNGLIDDGISCGGPLDGGTGCVPKPEVCNGIDDDCDGLIDNGNPGGGMSCGYNNVGACKLGSLVCTSGALLCVGMTGPTQDVCDGIDNDCNGVVDDNGVCNAGLPGDTCANAEQINQSQFQSTLAGYKDDVSSSCAPGQVDHIYQLNIPGGHLSVTLSGTGPLPTAWAVYQGSCGSLTEVFCGPSGGTTQALPAGTYYIAVEGSAPTAGFTVTGNLMP
jgi:hypothetical protein